MARVKKPFCYSALRHAVAIFGVMLAAIVPASAQGLPNNIDPEIARGIFESGASPEQIQKLMKGQQRGRSQAAQKSVLDEARESTEQGNRFLHDYGSFVDIDEPEPLSSIERHFNKRIWGAATVLEKEGYNATEILEQKDGASGAVMLRQFGYGNFTVPNSARQDGLGLRQEEVPLTGAISESYVLGIGDDLVVTFFGREEEAVTVRIDREGQLVLPRLPPVPAAGRTFGELRRDLELRVASTLVGTKVFVSLGAVRSIAVYVVGEVKKPGLHRLTSLSTIVDALIDAGGVLKTGSLRQIEITRGDRRFLLDSYDLFIRGGPNYDLSLVDGDRIFVPTISSTLAVAGDVKRPAIYELPYGRPEVTVAEALSISGGPIVPRGNRILLVSIDAAGREITREPKDLSLATISGGEYIKIVSAEGLAGGLITVKGHVNNPGPRSLAQTPTIQSLLAGNEIFRTNPYLYFAVLRRADPRTLVTNVIPINLRPVLDGEIDVGFQNRDELIVFGIDDVRFLISSAVQNAVRGRVTLRRESEEGESLQRACPAVSQLASLLDGERADRFVRAKYFSRRLGELSSEITNDNTPFNGDICPAIFREDPELLALLMEYSTILSGEVRRPGVYPLTRGTRLSGLFAAAGGLTVEADVNEIEITRSTAGSDSGQIRGRLAAAGANAGQATIGPGDTVRVNATYSSQDIGPVLVEGEVKRPGIYNIRRGERLSEIIKRAGGLTEQAFSKGAVFTREAARSEEQRSFRRLADQLQLSLASNLLVVGGSKGVDVGQVSVAAQQLVTQLREATPVGRVVIEADPTVLAVDPAMDTILQPGDHLVIPKRPNWISVSGAVLNPGTVQFKPGSDPRRYIEMVGGFSDAADESRVYIVYPDGRAQPVRTSFWNFKSVQLIPGSSVVVPMDSTPFRFLPIAREVTSIVAQLSLAAASLAVINRD